MSSIPPFKFLPEGLNPVHSKEQWCMKTELLPKNVCPFFQLLKLNIKGNIKRTLCENSIILPYVTKKFNPSLVSSNFNEKFVIECWVYQMLAKVLIIKIWSCALICDCC